MRVGSRSRSANPRCGVALGLTSGCAEITNQAVPRPGRSSAARTQGAAAAQEDIDVTVEKDGMSTDAALRSRGPARPTRRSGARAGRAEAARGGRARLRGPKGCGTGHLGRRCRPGTNERATHARCADAWAVASCSGDGLDSARPARPGRSGTTRRARERGRSFPAGAWHVGRAEVDLVRAHQADPEARRRTGAGTRVSPGDSERERASGARPLRVH
jgi:hypothetical protein